MESINNWFIDRESCTAVHDSGLIVRFEAAEDNVIDGFAVNKKAWLSSFPTHEHDIVLSFFPALMGQGADAYCQSLNRCN